MCVSNIRAAAEYGMLDNEARCLLVWAGFTCSHDPYRCCDVLHSVTSMDDGAGATFIDFV